MELLVYSNTTIIELYKGNTDGQLLAALIVPLCLHPLFEATHVTMYSVQHWTNLYGNSMPNLQEYGRSSSLHARLVERASASG